MTTYLAFNELEAMTFRDSSNVAPLTSGSDVLIANVNRSGIRCSNNGYFYRTMDAPLRRGWIHYRFAMRAANPGTRNPNGFAIRRGGLSSDIMFRTQRNSATYTQGTMWFLPFIDNTNPVYTSSSATGTIDVHFDLDAPFIRLFINGGDNPAYQLYGVPFLAAGAGVDTLSWSAWTTNSAAVSEHDVAHVVVSSRDTRGARVHTLPATSFASSAWVGNLSDISDTGLNAMTVVSAAAAGDTFLANKAAVAAALQTGYRAEAFVLSARTRRVAGAGVPTGLVGVVDRGGVVESGGVFNPGAYAPTAFVYPVDPTTGLPWDVLDIDAATTGLRALA